MNEDETEAWRRQTQAFINAEKGTRESLEAQYGKVWSTQELVEEYEIISFAAPFVVVRRRQDGKKGSLTFQHPPRFYFSWREG